MRFYLYRHIRLDKNEPFYVGIGSKKKEFSSYKAEYSRAYDRDRNNLWERIISKSSYEVEILYESNSYGEIKNKEQEFIALYGTIIKKTGPLANLTAGGEGTIGYKYSTECLQKLSNYRKGRSIPHHKNRKKTFQYTLSGEFIKEWNSISDAVKELSIPYSQISNCLNVRRVLSGGGFQWKNLFLGYKIPPAERAKKWPVKRLSDGKIFKNIKAVIVSINQPKGYTAIDKACRGVNKTAYKEMWKFVKDSDNKDDQTPNRV